MSSWERQSDGTVTAAILSKGRGQNWIWSLLHAKLVLHQSPSNTAIRSLDGWPRAAFLLPFPLLQEWGFPSYTWPCWELWPTAIVAIIFPVVREEGLIRSHVCSGEEAGVGQGVVVRTGIGELELGMCSLSLPLVIHPSRGPLDAILVSLWA